MSSLFRNARGARLRLLAAASLLAGAAPVAHAQQYFFVPEVEVSGEHHTNLDLTAPPLPVSSSNGYLGDFATILGLRTPASETQLRPRVILQGYSDQSNRRSDEEHLDLKSHYIGLSNTIDVFASYSRQDAYASELAPAQFDPFDPNNPSIGGTGLIRVGNTRTQAYIRPTIDHSLSKIFTIGFTGLYETTRYKSTLLGAQQDYDYAYAQPYLRRSLSERTDLSGGPVFVSYTTKNNGLKTASTDVYGFGLELTHRWTETILGRLEVQAQRGDTTDYVPTFSKDRNSAFSFLGTLDRRLEGGRLRFSLGRSLSPSGRGALSEADQARVQYDQDIRQRITISAAVRYLRDRTFGGLDQSFERKYLRGSIQATWDMTRNWFLFVGFVPTVQTYSTTPQVHDNAFQLGFGYEGLGPEHRLRIR